MVVAAVATTGLLALMSCCTSIISKTLGFMPGEWDGGKGAKTRTNDRRYESNDSREMGKCSISPLPPLPPPPLLLRSLDVRARYRRGQAPSRSIGDGGRYTPLSLTTSWVSVPENVC